MKSKSEINQTSNSNNQKPQAIAMPPKPKLPKQMVHSFSYGQFSDIQTTQTMQRVQSIDWSTKNNRTNIDHFNHSQQPSKSQQSDSQKKWVNKIKRSKTKLTLTPPSKLLPNKVSEDDFPTSITSNSIEEIKEILPNESLISSEEIKSLFDSDEEKHERNHSNNVIKRHVSDSAIVMNANKSLVTKDGTRYYPLSPPPRAIR